MSKEQTLPTHYQERGFLEGCDSQILVPPEESLDESSEDETESKEGEDAKY